jgi:lysophospholipase L1-like esterase
MTTRRANVLVRLGMLLTAAAAAGVAGCGSTAASATPSTTSATAPPPLRMVVIGDSIPNNSPQDCPGCTGFADRYAKAVQTATGRPVEVANHSQHNGLTLPGLLDELGQFRDRLAAADVVLVGIAHNSNELNADEPCGAPVKNDLPDWTVMTRPCAVRSAKAYRPLYDRLYAQIAGWRAGKPTILRTIDRYNDFIGEESLGLTPAQERITAFFVRSWNTMLCDRAKAHGFGCADIGTAFNGPDGLHPAGDLLAGDGTHPSDKGNEVIAHELAGLGFAPLA